MKQELKKFARAYRNFDESATILAAAIKNENALTAIGLNLTVIFHEINTAASVKSFGEYDPYDGRNFKTLAENLIDPVIDSLRNLPGITDEENLAICSKEK